MRKSQRVITNRHLGDYIEYLTEQERAALTIKKYSHDLRELSIFLNDEKLTKANLLLWKEHLMKNYAPASVNGMIAALNGFLNYRGWLDLKIKPLKIQKNLFREEDKELTQKEYCRLVHTAEREGNERLALVIQTICSTGIRVSELQFITAEAVQTGRAEVSNKGKRRIVFLPGKLRKLLGQYMKKQNRKSGAIFTTKKGKPLDRSNIWREMKALCGRAKVEAEKVFPHNLRHLFARVYYSMEKDLSRLADILGHSNINTTRIYTMETGCVHARQIERLGLIIT